MKGAHPQNFLRILDLQRCLRIAFFRKLLILRIFCGLTFLVEHCLSSEFSEDPQNFWRFTFCFLKVGHSQNFLRILQIFWGLTFLLKDGNPQNFLRIRRIFWGLIFLFCWKMVILRIFWGSSEFSEDYFFVQSWSSSEFSEDWFFLKKCSSSEFSEEFLFFESLPSSQFSDDPQNFLRVDPLLFESWSSSEFSEDPQNFLRIEKKMCW